MNENIDLTKILKNCPEGTKLYSPIWGEIYFKEMRNGEKYSIMATKKGSYVVSFTKKGLHYADEDGECLLFPSKDQRDWSKFTAPWFEKLIESKFNVGQYITDGYDVCQITSIEDEYNCYKILDFMGGVSTTIPFTLQDNYHLWTITDAKDGDVLALSWWEDKNLWEKIIIFKKYHSEGVKGLYSMPCIEGYGNTFKNGKIAFDDEKEPYYSKTWTCNLHPATKEQRDLLFQKIKEAGYKWNADTKTLEKLVKHKFDPKTLQPFDKVLARDYLHGKWTCGFFSHIVIFDNTYIYNIGEILYKMCIPYNEETKHLVGTTYEAPEYYRYWED